MSKEREEDSGGVAGHGAGGESAWFETRGECIPKVRKGAWGGRSGKGTEVGKEKGDMHTVCTSVVVHCNGVCILAMT